MRYKRRNNINERIKNNQKQLQEMDAKLLAGGEILTLTQYLTVESTSEDGNVIQATNQDGVSITFTGMGEQMTSSAQFTETKKVGKNAMAEILQGAGDKAFTVSFTKMDKTERILVGRFVSAEANLGRTKVIDLHLPADDRSQGIRQVDNREINWLVLDGIRYRS